MKGKRGRPRAKHAKRRTTTRIGRKTGQDPHDHGSPELLARKLALTGRGDLPLDPAAVLYGRELIDRHQFDQLGEITGLMRFISRAWGGKDGGVDGLWSALLGASTAGQSVVAVPTPPGADRARRRLERMVGKLNGSRDLVLSLAQGRTTPIVIRAWSRRLTPADAVLLERLRRDLDGMPTPAADR